MKQQILNYLAEAVNRAENTIPPPAIHPEWQLRLSASASAGRRYFRFRELARHDTPRRRRRSLVAAAKKGYEGNMFSNPRFLHRRFQ